MSNYRKIWIEHNGPIPVDEHGRTYEIHHKDGNRENNEPDNLMCLSIEDHYKIHEKQGDWRACHAIKLRMEHTPEEIKELATLAARQRTLQAFNLPHVREKNIKSMRDRIENGTFHLLKGDIQRKTNKRLVMEGKHIFQSQENKDRVVERNLRQINDGTHVFLGGDMQRRTQREIVVKGQHHFQTDEHKERAKAQQLERAKNGIHAFQKEKVCVFCGKVGKGAGFHMNHNKNCLDNPNCERVSCEYCGKYVAKSIYKRYHGDKCKQK